MSRTHKPLSLRALYWGLMARFGGQPRRRCQRVPVLVPPSLRFTRRASAPGSAKQRTPLYSRGIHNKRRRDVVEPPEVREHSWIKLGPDNPGRERTGLVRATGLLTHGTERGLLPEPAQGHQRGCDMDGNLLEIRNRRALRELPKWT